MSLEKSDGSPITKQKKDDWRVAKMIEYVYQTQVFDIRMDETLVQSWVNPMQRFLDSYCIPHLTYVEPSTDGFWCIPLSPNAKYFPFFKHFDLRIPDEHTLPMEFERLNVFHHKHGKTIEEIW